MPGPGSEAGRHARRARWPSRHAVSILAFSGALLCLAAFAFPARMMVMREGVQSSVPLSPRAETRLGINLFGLATFNRQQVFTNLISQSEWFSSRGQGWTVMPPDQLDARGWVRFLRPGQTAPRPLVLPPAPFDHAVVRCVFEGRGEIEVGGVARLRDRGDRALIIDLESHEAHPTKARGSSW